MSETEKFYTAEQKDVLKEYSVSKDAKRTTITESTGARILGALGEQQNTLQNHVLNREFFQMPLYALIKSRIAYQNKSKPLAKVLYPIQCFQLC